MGRLLSMLVDDILIQRMQEERTKPPLGTVRAIDQVALPLLFCAAVGALRWPDRWRGA